MGTQQSKPSNKIGKNVVRQKLEIASKTGVLSLCEHNLVALPEQLLQMKKIRTLDLSKNKIKRLPNQVSTLTSMKSLKLDSNKLTKGSLQPISKLSNLTTLSLSENKLGIDTDKEGKKIPGQALPSLPSSLKLLKLNLNHFQNIPPTVYARNLINLEKLDLSKNNLASVPVALFNHLKALVELNLDHNSIVSLPGEIENLKKLKSLSLEQNKIAVYSSSGRKSTVTKFSEQNPQPLPAVLFTATPIIDLNLKGNAMTNTQLNEFEGFDTFLERRQKLKTKNIYGGAMTDLKVCGLD
eukprot:153548_1